MNDSDATIDYVGRDDQKGLLAGQLTGAGQLNIGAMRPFTHDGKSYIALYQGGDASKTSSYKTIQTNKKGTLRRDEWRQLDKAVLGVARRKISGVQDLINRGLTYNLGSAMATTVLESQTISDALKAQLSMDGVSRTQNDRQEYESKFLPIPILHADFEINLRELEASRGIGNPLDTTMAENAARRILEKREAMLFGDQQYSFGGGTIYSFLNFPDRDVSLKGKLNKWTTSDGKTIVKDVLELKEQSLVNKHFGPWILYISSNYEPKMDKDYSDVKGSNTIRDRILDINNISEVMTIDDLPDDNMLLVQATPDVVRIVQGMGIQNIQWETEAGFIKKFKVLAIQVPQLRADQEGNCGIIHGSWESETQN